MKEDFVPQHLAKKLLDKGYPMIEIPTGGRDNRSIPVLFELPEDHPDWQYCKAWWIPTIYQVLKWLREEKHIHVAAGVTPKSLWRYIIMFTDERGLNEPTVTVKNFPNYESAMMAGIEYVLDNLI